MGKLSLVNYEDWEFLLQNSPQRTRFLDPNFIEIFDCAFRLYHWIRKGVPALGLPVIDTTGWGEQFLPMCYYQGPIFNKKFLRGKGYNSTKNQIELVEEAVSALCEIENHFSFSLHSSLTDVRGFDWVHYHNNKKARLQIKPKYTAVLSLENKSSKEIRAAARSSRRQEENYAKIREGLFINKTKDCDNLLKLYAKSFQKQRKTVGESEINLLRRFVSYFLDLGVGHILEVVDKCNIAVAAGFIFEDYDKVWHCPIVGVGDTKYGGTLLYFGLLDFVRTKNAKLLDFNGANSPSRSYFKHSVGAKPILFFEVNYKAL